MQSDKKRKELGIRGEEIACEELRQRGLIILERNFRGGRNEIDIICSDGKDVRFVEVKARQLPMQGEAWEAVNGAKQRNISKAARSYINSPALKRLPFSPQEYHFDVVTVVWNEKGDAYVTEYIPDAFFLIYF